MKGYTAKWYNIDSDETDFFISDNIDSGSYNILENQYSANNFEMILELQQLNKTFSILQGEAYTIINDNQGVGLPLNNYNNTDTFEITFDDTMLVDDYFWLDDEIFRVVSRSGFVHTCRRGQFNSRMTGHKIIPGLTQVYKGGRNTPIGLECAIYDDNNTYLGDFYIRSADSNGSSLIISMDSLINKIEDSFTYTKIGFWPPKYNSEDEENNLFNVGRLLNTSFGRRGNTDVVKIDKRIINLALRIDVILDVDSDFIDYNASDMLKVFLNLMNFTLSFNVTTGQYETVYIRGYSAFETDDDIGSIYDKIDFSGGYKSSLSTLGYNSIVKYIRDDGSEYTYALSASSVFSGAMNGGDTETKEIDLTDYRGFSINELKPFLKDKAQTLGLTLGHFEFDLLPGHDIETGKFYSIDDFTNVNELVIFGDYSSSYVLYCYSSTTFSANLLLLDISKFNPVAPAILVRGNASGELDLITSIEEDNNIGNQLVANYDNDNFTLEHLFLDYYFFEEGISEIVEVRASNNYDLIATNELLVSSDYPNTLKISGFTPVDETYYIICYPSVINENTKQSKHLHFNSGVI